MKKQWILIFFLGTITGLFAKEVYEDIRVIESNEVNCVVHFSPTDFHWQPARINNTLYQKAQFQNGCFVGEPGDPAIPSRVLIFGVPLKGDVKISVLSSNYTEIDNIRLLSIPEIRKENGIGYETYQEGKRYRTAGFQPDQLIEMIKPEYMAEQRIVRVIVNPIQYDPVRQKIHLYQEIVFRITFPEDNFKEIHPYESGNELLFKGMLVNYQISKKWRKTITRPLFKTNQHSQVGEKYKISIIDDNQGLYKITGSDLKQNNINIGSIDPQTIKIYNNGGRELAREWKTNRLDSLLENPILVIGTEDNTFDESDYILFYGRGVRGWIYDEVDHQYAHYNNYYTIKNIYWLVFNDGIKGKRIQETDSPSLQEAEPVLDFRDHYFVEQDLINPEGRGLNWVGDVFSEEVFSRTYSLPLVNLDETQSLDFQFLFKSFESSYSLAFEFNDKSVTTFSGSSIKRNPDGVTIVEGIKPDDNQFTLKYIGASNRKVYLDWFEVTFTRKLHYSPGGMIFYSAADVGDYTYQISNLSQEPLVLDITQQSQIKKMSLIPNGQEYRFQDSIDQDERKTYIVVLDEDYKSITEIEKDNPSDLRNPFNEGELVIISHRDFFDEALRLKNHHETFDTLKVFLTDIQDVFDEFSWGLYDPVAIRDFVKFGFDHWAVRPRFLLLFGDGDYDYRNISSDNDQNWIPPLEMTGTRYTGNRATDDWYTYVSGEDDAIMDLSVGRLTVQTEEEAKIVVDKIINYDTKPDFGAWRSTITLVGDDEISATSDTESTHINASEVVARKLPKLFNTKKIYLTEYTREVVGHREQKPQAREDFIDQINRGSLIVNYIGHGNQQVLAHEFVFNRDRDLPFLENGNKLPLLYGATCELGWFDKADEQSFTEELLTAQNKGTIGVISASRECIASSNEKLNIDFIQELFSKNGKTMRLGLALQRAKLFNSANQVYNEMYHLFGDPAQRLGMPKYNGVITKVEPDTFKALSVIRVAGDIKEEGGSIQNFNGQVLLMAFDGVKQVHYESQTNSTILNYDLPGNNIFRGEVGIKKGQFELSFIVPKDITYGAQTGRIILYFYNEMADGGGYMDSIEVGGSVQVIDNQGPEIELGFADQENFFSGGLVPEDPVLKAIIQDDKSGVNIAGGIGHKIIVTFDDNIKEDVTQYFKYDEGSYLKGSLEFPIMELDPDYHELKIKAWDNANNSSTQSIVFQIVPNEELFIRDVLNYPNPFDHSTHFTFFLNQVAQIEIKIYTLSGRLIKKLQGISGNPGFNMVPDNEVGWDGRDERGDELANGVYLYKINAKTNIEGRTVRKEVLGRMMVMH